MYYYGKDLFARGLPNDVCFACAIKGKVNDVPQIRKIFSQFKIKEVGTSYTCGSKNPHRLKSLSSQIAIFRGREKYALKGF